MRTSMRASASTLPDAAARAGDHGNLYGRRHHSCSPSALPIRHHPVVAALMATHRRFPTISAADAGRQKTESGRINGHDDGLAALTPRFLGIMRHYVADTPTEGA